jgi:hypothetical protein
LYFDAAFAKTQPHIIIIGNRPEEEQQTFPVGNSDARQGAREMAKDFNISCDSVLNFVTLQFAPLLKRPARYTTTSDNTSSSIVFFFSLHCPKHYFGSALSARDT